MPWGCRLHGGKSHRTVSEFLPFAAIGVSIRNPRVIRDSLVEKIWEGTTTVLSLDFVRASQDPETLNAFITVGFIRSVEPSLILEHV